VKHITRRYLLDLKNDALKHATRLILRVCRLLDRFASCFHDERHPQWIEHEVATLVGQQVFGIALGYEDLNDRDELRHDPMRATLAGKLAARRKDCAPLAGKSTLNRWS
jgi:hypothetical protein